MLDTIGHTNQLIGFRKVALHTTICPLQAAELGVAVQSTVPPDEPPPPPPDVKELTDFNKVLMVYGLFVLVVNEKDVCPLG
jgi:hypothetical protein